jgi:hypothetical protein
MSDAVSLICRGKAYEIETLISPEDYAWAVSRGNWFVTHGTARDGKSYVARSDGGVLIFLHKAVLARSFKLPPSRLHTIGDHEDGNSLNNQRGNLRWATVQMNARNRYGFAALQMELL